MRNLMWRLTAVVLAACLGWLIHEWPEDPEPVVFSLIDCDNLPLGPYDTKVWAECKKAVWHGMEQEQRAHP